MKPIFECLIYVLKLQAKFNFYARNQIILTSSGNL